MILELATLGLALAADGIGPEKTEIQCRIEAVNKARAPYGIPPMVQEEILAMLLEEPSPFLQHFLGYQSVRVYHFRIHLFRYRLHPSMTLSRDDPSTGKVTHTVHEVRTVRYMTEEMLYRELPERMSKFSEIFRLPYLLDQSMRECEGNYLDNTFESIRKALR